MWFKRSSDISRHLDFLQKLGGENMKIFYRGQPNKPSYCKFLLHVDVYNYSGTSYDWWWFNDQLECLMICCIMTKDRLNNMFLKFFINVTKQVYTHQTSI
jgi:hypothetical protein